MIIMKTFRRKEDKKSEYRENSDNNLHEDDNQKFLKNMEKGTAMNEKCYCVQYKR